MKMVKMGCDLEIVFIVLADLDPGEQPENIR